MSLPSDRNLDRPAGEEENVIDRLPPNQRGQDEGRTETTHQIEGSRPLTSAEREAAEHDKPLPERVYAPASERVPKEPVPGHRDMVEHTDTATPERQAVAEETSESEPTFARAARPSTPPPETPMASAAAPYTTRASSTTTPMPTPIPTPYASPSATPGVQSAWDEHAERPMWQRGGTLMGFGWLVLPACAVVGVWWYMRRRREQNKPINRLRRRALHTAAEIREHVPSSDDLVQPAMGVLAALLSTGVMVGRQVQRQRTFKRATGAVSDADLQKRLNALKERWHPGRLELEKISISRHR
jgi:hypothetical protein